MQFEGGFGRPFYVLVFRYYARVGWGELRSSDDANRFAQKGDFGGGFDCRLGRLRRLRVLQVV
jgi:hypothetical protein